MRYHFQEVKGENRGIVMQCVQCSMDLKNVNNYCPLCGKKYSPYQGIKHVDKKTIDDALRQNNFDFLWELFETGQEPYAEYEYEKFLLSKARAIDTPSDFDIFTNKIRLKSENGNMYAKYLYGKAMRVVFGKGLLDGFSFLMSDEQKCRDGAEIIKQAASNGQASAEWTVGLWLLDGGAGMTKNEREAYRYISSAAQKGHPRAMLKLGEIYKQGMAELKKNSKKAAIWVRAAAYFGCDTAKVPIREEEYWVQKKDVEEIAEFYGLNHSDASNDDAGLPMCIRFS